MASSDARPAFRLPWQSGHGSESRSEASATAVVDAPAWPSHDLLRRQQSDSADATTAPINGAPATDTDADVTSAEVTGADEAEAYVPDMTETRTAPDGMVDAPATTDSTDHTDLSEAPTADADMPATTPEVPQSPWQQVVASTPAVDGRGRKPMKFLADLTRAMRSAADEVREQTLSQFHGEVTRHVESAHAQAETAAAEARGRADADVATLRDWCKAEIVRIKQETEDGATARHTRLDAELSDQKAGLELELERVQERVRAYEAEMETFFQQLLQNDDPTTFASMAEQLPEPPTFETWQPEMTIAMTVPDTESSEMDAPVADGEMASWDANMATASNEGDAAGVSEAVEATDAAGETDGAEPTAQVDDSATGEAEVAVDWAAGEAEVAPDTQHAEAESTGDNWHASKASAKGGARTQVAVVGLVSVASIATFKRLLSRAPGIHAVQVASGPDGEFVFSATHDDGCDVAAAVASLQGFEVQVVDSSPGVVNARAVDPEIT